MISFPWSFISMLLYLGREAPEDLLKLNWILHKKAPGTSWDDIRFCGCWSHGGINFLIFNEVHKLQISNFKRIHGYVGLDECKNSHFQGDSPILWSSQQARWPSLPAQSQLNLAWNRARSQKKKPPTKHSKDTLKILEEGFFWVEQGCKRCPQKHFLETSRHRWYRDINIGDFRVWLWFRVDGGRLIVEDGMVSNDRFTDITLQLMAGCQWWGVSPF